MFAIAASAVNAGSKAASSGAKAAASAAPEGSAVGMAAGYVASKLDASPSPAPALTARLQLEGACGDCPSSTMTMKMGLERRLKEAIPEISEVVQVLPDAPDITEEAVDEVLDGVRPFLSVAGGSIDLVSVSGSGGIQPTVVLKLEGKSASLFSVKNEISQRIHRHFMASGLRVEWDGDNN